MSAYSAIIGINNILIIRQVVFVDMKKYNFSPLRVCDNKTISNLTLNSSQGHKQNDFIMAIGEKNEYFTVRLTVSVYPPPP